MRARASFTQSMALEWEDIKKASFVLYSSIHLRVNLIIQHHLTRNDNYLYLTARLSGFLTSKKQYDRNKQTVYETIAHYIPWRSKENT